MDISLHSIRFLANLQILDQIDPGFRRITLRTQTTAHSAPCTACGTPSQRVHGFYWRSLGDLAGFGRPTVLLVRVRRFRCTVPTCPRRTFAEPLPGIARPLARQTDRLCAVHRAIGLALGGNPGARLAASLGVPISRTTLLTRVRAGGTTLVPPVAVLGVDDWAWRKGTRYGTILCDLERHRVVDLLPDRSAETLAAWLERHPGVSVVVRDRAGAYAEGARKGAPDATQVADRWHLLRNGSDALQQVLDQHHRDLRAAARTAAAPSEMPAPEETRVQDVPVPTESERPVRAAERRSRVGQERRDARFAEAARLHRQGLSLQAIARTIGADRKTVSRWLRAGHAPTWRHADRATSILDPYRAYLTERWQAGCRNAAALWRDLRNLGFAGQYTVVREWATRRRRDERPANPKEAPHQPAAITAPEPPTPRRAVRLLTGDPEKLSDQDRRLVTALRQRSPTIATAVDLATRFATMVKDQVAGALDGWLREAETGALAPFAASLVRCQPAPR